MSCFNCASSEEERAGRKSNKRITEDLKKSRTRNQFEVKILLLGAGESGKSTIVKQMKIIHENGFTEQERIGSKEHIFDHVKSSMQLLLQYVEEWEPETTEQELEQIEVFKTWDALNSNSYPKSLPKPIAEAVDFLWHSDAIQFVASRSNEFHFIDCAPYYFENVNRLAEDDYIPSEADVLRTRVRTSGIVETRFWYNQLHIRMVDVGGQRSERKKWIHCFEGVTAIIFCAALSAYDSVLLEDDDVNRMQESLELFESVCSSNWFKNTSIILFLNKTDLLEAKLEKRPLTVCFPDYPGDNSYENAATYIKDRFVERNTNLEKQIYCHYTCATDTDIIKKVFKDVTNMIINHNLKVLGLL